MNYIKRKLKLLVIVILAVTIAVIISLIIRAITKHYILVMAILLILMKIFYPKFRGIMGEFWVKQELKKLPKDKYKVLNDIMLKTNDMTHQIDHVIVSPYGIFVIEMKNYYGLISGTDNNDKWIQYLGKNKFYFKNPIHQNYGHVKTLEELLNLDNKLFIPIVCFSNQAKLKVETKNNVVPLDYLVSSIGRYQNIILESDLEPLYNRIVELNIKDKLERRNHVKNIKNKIAEDKEKIENMLCPKCGGNLVARNSKYGLFIGCSNYPKCKFIKNNQ